MRNTKETITKETKTKGATPNGVAGVQEVFDVFYKSVNPTINFGNKTNRMAAENLIKKFGLERILKIAEYACKVQGQKYAPTITTPFSLQEKLASLKIFYEREKKKTNTINFSNSL